MTTSSFPIHDGSGDAPDELDGLNEHVLEPGDPDGVVAAEERQRWQERRPAPPPTPRAEFKHKRRWPWVLLVLALMVGVTYGSYLLGNSQGGKKKPEKSQSTSASAQVTTSADANAIKNYSSSNFSLNFNYPGDWAVSETAQKLTVTSPVMELKNAVGSKTKAHVIVTVQNQESTIAGFPSGGATASLASTLLTYKQPSADQVAQTYLSYLSYTAPNGLDEIYLTGNNGYQQGQAIPESDLVQVDPLISVGFESCQSAMCTTGSHDSVSLSASSWASSAASQQVMNLLESIVITDTD